MSANAPQADPADGTGPAPWRRIYTILLLIGLVLIAWQAWKPVVYTSRIIVEYPYQIDREEGFLLLHAMRLARGESIYVSLTEPPFIAGTYAPVYPVAYAALVKAFGPSMAAGRLLALLSALAIAVLAVGFVRRETRCWLPALIAPLFLFLSRDFNHWVPFARVDLTANLLGLAGFIVAIRCPLRKGIIAASILFILAFYTKQTQLVAPLAVLLALLWGRKWTDAKLLLAVSAGGALLTLVTLVALTRGQYWIHAIVYNANEFDKGQLAIWARHLVRFGLFSLIAGVLSSLWLLFAGRAAGLGDPRQVLINRAVAIYFLLALVSLVGLGKVGAAANYFLEYHAITGIAVGLAIGRLIAGPVMSRLEFALAWTLGVLVFAHGVMLNRPFYRAVTFLPPPPAEARQLGDYLLMRVSETQGPVLSEDAVVNILARKDVPYHPFIMSQLVREGKWDPAPFLTMLRDEHFQLVVTEKNLETEYFYGFTEEMRDVLLERYELDEVIPFYPGSQRFVYALRNNP